MGKPIPALGYPSLTQAILALTADDKSIPEIARILDRKPMHIRSLLRHAKNPQARKRLPERRISFAPSIQDGLRPYALRRGMSVPDFIRYFLKTAIDAGLIDGVLDDDATGSTSSVENRVA